MNRVLSIVYDLGKGGTQRACQTFARAYATLGYDSRVLAMSAHGPRLSELNQTGIPVLDGTNPQDVASAIAWKPDLVHIHSHNLDDQFQSILARLKAAFILETNVFSAPTPWSSMVDYSLQLSDWCHWLYAYRSGEGHAPGLVIPYPVDPSRFEPVGTEGVAQFRSRWNIPPDALVIGRIGQAYNGKWSDLLIEAFDALASSFHNLWLLQVNAPPDVLDLSSQSQFRHRIRNIDRLIGDTRLAQAYSSMDVFAHAADQGESFGYVLTEAMLCGTPVVTLSTPWGDNSQVEVVKHGMGGFVATTRTGFIDALAELLTSSQVRRRMGKTGRRSVSTRYDHLRTAEDAIALAGSPGAFESPPDCSQIRSIYLRSYDQPSRLSLVALRHPSLRTFTRYTSGYDSWGSFGKSLWQRWF